MYCRLDNGRTNGNYAYYFRFILLLQFAFTRLVCLTISHSDVAAYQHERHENYTSTDYRSRKIQATSIKAIQNNYTCRAYRHVDRCNGEPRQLCAKIANRCSGSSATLSWHSTVGTVVPESNDSGKLEKRRTKKQEGDSQLFVDGNPSAGNKKIKEIYIAKIKG